MGSSGWLRLWVLKSDAQMQVEPFQRSLQDMQVDVMINGRRRDHGFERAQLEVNILFSRCSRLYEQTH